MSTKEIEAEIAKLTPRELAEVHEFIENVMEDQLTVDDMFQASIDRGLADIAAGRVRVRAPGEVYRR